MSRKIVLFILIAVLAGGIGAYVGMQRIKPQTPQTKALTQLLSQTLPDPAGQPQALSKWQGKPLLINFWASWCGPCVEEMPELEALHKEIPALQIIGIGVDSAPKIIEFAGKLNIDYPLYVAGTNAISVMRDLGNTVGGLPFTLLVGADGTIQQTYIGAIDFDKLHKDIASGITPKLAAAN
ncbi:MAG: alkyl hydroperoxide reductase [Mucilaginibacter sp.]|nr:alkyl hydroperoxide reductase [Mucilaginibacter sp.]